MAYRSFSLSGLEARGVRKVTTCGSFRGRCQSGLVLRGLCIRLTAQGDASKLRGTPKALGTNLPQ
jgi:hypothetical protein